MSASTQLTGLSSDESRARLPRALAAAYLAGIAGLLIIAGVIAVVPGARVIGHDLFPVVPYHSSLKAPPATVRRALWLLETNLEGTLAPLLAVAIGIHRWRGYRVSIHAFVVWALISHLVPVGVTLGIYGPRAAQHLPHLPFELYACVAGPTVWFTAVKYGLTRRRLALVAVSILIALLIAAALETWADPVL